MNVILPWLFNATLGGTGAILLTLALGPLVRKTLGAQAAHGLWAVALILLLCPWQPRSPVGVGRTSSDLPAVVVEVMAPPVSAPDQILPQPARPRPIPWLLLVWGTGVCILLGLSILRVVRAGRLVLRSREITDRPTVQAALRTMEGLPDRMKVCESADLMSPAVCGLWRPVILLPPGWVNRVGTEELRCVLWHEIGHIRRGDLWWCWAFQVAQAVHWFNPLVWLGGRMARVDQEMACDEWVLGHGNWPDEEVYGEVILRTARRVGVPRLTSPAQAGMAETNRGLARRMHHLAVARTRGVWASLAAVGLGLWVFLLLSPGYAEPEIPSQAMERSESVATQVEVEAKFLEASPDIITEILAGMDDQAVLAPREFEDILRKLNQVKGVDLLSAPKVTVQSGKRALVQVVREFSYPTRYNTEGAPAEFEVRNLGVTLTIEPFVTEGGRILCVMEPEVVEFLGFINYGANKPGRDSLTGDAIEEALVPGTETGQVLNQPVFQTRKVQTTVSLKSGQTVLLGGLSRKDKQMVMDHVDGEFKQTEQEGERVLYVFVTVRLMDTEGRPVERSGAATHRQDADATAPGPPVVPSPIPISVAASPSDHSAKNGLPYGSPVPGKPGFITSP